MTDLTARAQQELATREADPHMSTDALEAGCETCGNPAWNVVDGRPLCDHCAEAA